MMKGTVHVPVLLKKVAYGEQQDGKDERKELAKSVYLEFVSKYLENLGISPSLHHKKNVMNCMPLSDCEFIGNWNGQGESSIASSVTLKPLTFSTQEKSSLVSTDSGHRRGEQLRKELDSMRMQKLVKTSEISMINSLEEKEWKRNWFTPSACFFNQKIYSWKDPKIFMEKASMENLLKDEEFVSDLASPLNVPIPEISEIIENFIFNEFSICDKKMHELVLTENFCRLVGLFGHFSFWMIFGFIHIPELGIFSNRMLSTEYRISILFTILKIWRKIQVEMNISKGKNSMHFILLILKVGAHRILKKVFPRIFAISETVNFDVRLRINAIAMYLLDPEGFLSALPSDAGNSNSLAMMEQLRRFEVYKMSKKTGKVSNKKKCEKISSGLIAAFKIGVISRQAKNLLMKSETAEFLSWWLEGISKAQISEKFCKIILENKIL